MMGENHLSHTEKCILRALNAKPQDFFTIEAIAKELGRGHWVRFINLLGDSDWRASLHGLVEKSLVDEREVDGEPQYRIGGRGRTILIGETIDQSPTGSLYPGGLRPARVMPREPHDDRAR